MPWFSLPPLSAREAAVVAETLAELAPELPKPAEDATVHLRVVDAPLQPVLQIDTIATHGNRAWRGFASSLTGDAFDVARPLFRYADVDVRPGDHHEFITLPEGETVHLKRRPEAEICALQALTAAGFEKIPSHILDTFGRPPEGFFGLASEPAWIIFMRDGRDALRAAGWQVEYPDDFRHHLLEVDGWEADLVASDNGWFDLDMGIIVDGRRLALAPLLAALFRRDARWLDSALIDAIADGWPACARAAGAGRPGPETLAGFLQACARQRSDLPPLHAEHVPVRQRQSDAAGAVVDRAGERLALSPFQQMLLVGTLPLLMLPFAIVPCARYYDRVHIIEFRSVHAWSFVAASVAFLIGCARMQIPWLVFGSLLLGVGFAGGQLGWNLGHNDFARPEQAALYMGVHVTPTGMRGLAAPLIGVALYRGVESLWAGHGFCY